MSRRCSSCSHTRNSVLRSEPADAIGYRQMQGDGMGEICLARHFVSTSFRAPPSREQAKSAIVLEDDIYPSKSHSGLCCECLRVPSSQIRPRLLVCGGAGCVPFLHCYVGCLLLCLAAVPPPPLLADMWLCACRRRLHVAARHRLY